MLRKASKKSSKTARVKTKARARLRPPEITEDYIDLVCQRLRVNKQVRRSLPGWGRLHIDRQLPFLCVYRKPDGKERPGAERLVLGEASYLTASGSELLQPQLSSLVKAIARIMVEAFGSFLILEIWEAPNDVDSKGRRVGRPTFRIVKARASRLRATPDAFVRALSKIRIENGKSDVEIVSTSRVTPPGLSPLLASKEAKEIGCHILGIEVRPIYRNHKTGKEFPEIRRTLRRRLGRAYKLGIFEFVRRNTTHRPAHYQALGRRALTKVVWTIDQRLADISNSFDFLLNVTPTNVQAAWRAFKRKGFERSPLFQYRPLPIDPALLKRDLFKTPIERIEDPTLSQLFRDQQMELERKLTMLSDRGTPRFLGGSLSLFGGVDSTLLSTAQGILDGLPANRSRERFISVEAFATRVKEEVGYFALTHPDVTTRVQVRDDIAGLMVSRGNVLIGSSAKIPVSRIRAALAHEVETHVLTYLNGRAQPFKQLYVGLPGYEELQEGLAVLAEYLVGGLSRARMRLLAARVVAADCLIDGASFIDVFRKLSREYNFTQRGAFNIAMRVFRGGGLTKDAVYLRGLIRVQEYLQQGGLLEPLLVGKLAVEHVSMIRELQHRHVLGSPRLRPRYLEDPAAMKRLERVRGGLSLLDIAGMK